MGKRMLAGLARAESREDNGKWEVGRVDRKEGGMARGGWQRGGGDREGESGRVQRGGGDGKGAIGTGRGWQWGGGMR